MWCPNCKKIRVCAAIPLTYLGYESGQRFYRSEHPDINWFRRGRRCKKCKHDFTTAEMNEEFLDELVELRKALSGLKTHAEEYISESDAASKSLKKLSESLGVLRALRVYKEAKG